MIDNDPQGNASTALGIDHRAGTPSIYDVLVDERADRRRGAAEPGRPGPLGACPPRSTSPVRRSSSSRWSRVRRVCGTRSRPTSSTLENGSERIDYVFDRLPAEPRPADGQRLRRRPRGPDPDPVRVLRARGPEPAAQDDRADPGAPEPGPACLHDPADDVRRAHQPGAAGRRRGPDALPERDARDHDPAFGPRLGGPELRPDRHHLRLRLVAARWRTSRQRAELGRARASARPRTSSTTAFRRTGTPIAAATATQEEHVSEKRRGLGRGSAR